MRRSRPQKLIPLFGVFFFALFASCATDPGSTAITTGGAVTYDNAGLAVHVNVVATTRDSRGSVVYVGANVTAGSEVGASTANGVTVSIDNNVTLTLPSSCTSGATIASVENYHGGLWRIWTYVSSCVFAASDVFVATATGSVSSEGNTRSLSGSVTTTPTSSNLTQHTVFVTSSTYSANLGGLSGADTACQTAAAQGIQTASLTGGTWRAILSSESTSAVSRLNFSSIPIKTTHGETVVNTASQIWSGTLLSAIVYNENGISEGLGSTFTGSNTAGTSATGFTCQSWTSNNVVDTPRSGSIAATNSTWISQFAAADCSATMHLYCIYVNN